MIPSAVIGGFLQIVTRPVAGLRWERQLPERHRVAVSGRLGACGLVLMLAALLGGCDAGSRVRFRMETASAGPGSGGTAPDGIRLFWFDAAGDELFTSDGNP